MEVENGSARDPFLTSTILRGFFQSSVVITKRWWTTTPTKKVDAPYLIWSFTMELRLPVHEEDSNEVGGSCLAKPSCGQVLWVKKYGPMMSISSFKDLIIYWLFFFPSLLQEKLWLWEQILSLVFGKVVFLKQRLFCWRIFRQPISWKWTYRPLFAANSCRSWDAQHPGEFSPSQNETHETSLHSLPELREATNFRTMQGPGAPRTHGDQVDLIFRSLHPLWNPKTPWKNGRF